MNRLRKLVASVVVMLTMLMLFDTAMCAESLLKKDILKKLDFESSGINDDCFNRNDQNIEQYVEGVSYYNSSRGTLFTNNTGLVMYNSYNKNYHCAKIISEEGRGKVFKLISNADGTEDTQKNALDLRLGFGTADTDFSNSTLCIEYDAKIELNEAENLNNASLLSVGGGYVKNNNGNLQMCVSGYNGAGVLTNNQPFNIGVQLAEWFKVSYEIDTQFDKKNSDAVLRYTIKVTNKEGQNVVIGPMETNQALTVFNWNGNYYSLGLVTHSGIYSFDNIKIYTREKFKTLNNELGQVPVDARLNVKMNNFISESSLDDVKLEKDGEEISSESYEVALSADKQSITIDLIQPLEYGSSYDVDISKLLDSEGSKIVDGGKIPFTTEPIPRIYISEYKAKLESGTYTSPTELDITEAGLLNLSLNVANSGDSKQVALICAICDSNGKMIDYQFVQKHLQSQKSESFVFGIPVSNELSGGCIMVYSWNGLFEMGVNQIPLIIKIR